MTQGRKKRELGEKLDQAEAAIDSGNLMKTRSVLSELRSDPDHSAVSDEIWALETRLAAQLSDWISGGIVLVVVATVFSIYGYFLK